MKLLSTHTPLLPHVTLSPITPSFSFGAVMLAELHMMLKGLRWWWYVVMAGLNAVSLVVSLGVAREFMLPLAWVWPIALWLAMGVREAHYQTDALVFSTAYPLRHQLLATWLAGVLVTLALGVWSKTGKVFEACYMLLWYLGPVNKIIGLDFMGTTDTTIGAGVPIYVFTITLVLLGLAVPGRQRQIRT